MIGDFIAYEKSYETNVTLVGKYPVIHDEQLPPCFLLSEHTLKGAPEHVRTIVCRQYDRKERHHLPSVINDLIFFITRIL